MIGFLRGEVIDLDDTSIVLLVGNIGYEINFGIEPRSFCHLEEILSIYTYLNVREDAMELYGFQSKRDKDIFMQLKTVTGIGAKSAIQMTSAIEADTLIQAIIHGDERVLQKLPGCGKKTSQRIILELQDRFRKIYDITDQPEAMNSMVHNGVLDDISLALIALGYQNKEISTALASLGDISNRTEQEIIKDALTLLRKN